MKETKEIYNFIIQNVWQSLTFEDTLREVYLFL